jgi:hypothetical protein
MKGVYKTIETIDGGGLDLGIGSGGEEEGESCAVLNDMV